MLHGLSLRVSWICLLLFSSALCFPAVDEYQYPYTDASTDDSSAPLSVADPEPSMDVSDDTFSPRSGTQQGSQGQHQGSQGQQQGSQGQHQGSQGQQQGSQGQQQGSQGSQGQQQGSQGQQGYQQGSQGQSGASAAYSPSFAAAPAHYAPVSYSAPAASYGGSGGYYAPAGSYGGSRGYSAPAGSYSGFGSYGGSDAEGTDGEGTLVYSRAPRFRFEGPSFGNKYVQLPRISFESFNPKGWMPSRSFPDFTVWGAEEAADSRGSKGSKGGKGVQQEEEEEETFAVPSSSYIVQTMNGYQRAREVSSHMNYSPEVPEPAVIYYEVKQKEERQEEQVKQGKGQQQQQSQQQ